MFTSRTKWCEDVIALRPHAKMCMVYEMDCKRKWMPLWHAYDSRTWVEYTLMQLLSRFSYKKPHAHTHAQVLWYYSFPWRLPETMGIIRNATLCHEMKGFYCSVSKSPYQWQSAIVTSELKDWSVMTQPATTDLISMTQRHHWLSSGQSACRPPTGGRK